MATCFVSRKIKWLQKLINPRIKLPHRLALTLASLSTHRLPHRQRQWLPLLPRNKSISIQKAQFLLGFFLLH
jgi:hypothetical protein